MRTSSWALHRYVRPCEWILISFLAYCSLRLLIAPQIILSRAWFNAPSSELLAILAITLVLKAGLFLKKHNPRQLGSIGLLILAILCGGWILGLNVAPGELKIQGPGEDITRFFSLIRPLILLTVPGTLAWLLWKSPERKSLLQTAPRAILESVRECAPLLLILSFYPLAPILIASSGRPAMDDQIAGLDRLLFAGTNPVKWLEAYVSQPLSEWMSFAYTVYGFFFLFVVGLFFMKEDRKPFRHASFALCSAFALGYIGYILAPVKGPLFTQHFDTDLGIYYTRDIKEALMDRYRIEYDCFPSLHTAIGLILSWECWKYARTAFWITLPVVISIPLACVYLRYHYVTDVLAGALLAFGVVALIRTLGDKVFGQIPA